MVNAKVHSLLIGMRGKFTMMVDGFIESNIDTVSDLVHVEGQEFSK